MKVLEQNTLHQLHSKICSQLATYTCMTVHSYMHELATYIATCMVKQLYSFSYLAIPCIAIERQHLYNFNLELIEMICSLAPSIYLHARMYLLPFLRHIPTTDLYLASYIAIEGSYIWLNMHYQKLHVNECSIRNYFQKTIQLDSYS